MCSARCIWLGPTITLYQKILQFSNWQPACMWNKDKENYTYLCTYIRLFISLLLCLPYYLLCTPPTILCHVYCSLCMYFGEMLAMMHRKAQVIPYYTRPLLGSPRNKVNMSHDINNLTCSYIYMYILAVFVHVCVQHMYIHMCLFLFFTAICPPISAMPACRLPSISARQWRHGYRHTYM